MLHPARDNAVHPVCLPLTLSLSFQVRLVSEDELIAGDLEIIDELGLEVRERGMK